MLACGALFMGTCGFVAGYLLDQPGFKPPQGKHEVNVCKESRYERLDERGRVIPEKSRSKNCSYDYHEISKRYAIIGKNAYWVSRNTYIEPACLRGSGVPIQGLFNLLSWDCWAAPSKIYNHEDRNLWFVAKRTPGFRPLSTSDVTLPEWKREQFEHYSVNESSVFFESEKIQGANPQSFTPIFPFDDEKWSHFFFSRSRNTIFLAGNPIPDIRIERFSPLKPVECPGHGLRCPPDYSDPGYWGYQGVLGTVDGDVVFLAWDGASIFKGMASKDIFMFMTAKHKYLFSNGKFHEVLRGGASGSATLVDMDVNAYEYGKAF